MASTDAQAQRVVIALLPLWGALIGALGAALVPYALAIPAVLLWVAAGRMERYIIGFPRPWILTAIMAAFWFAAFQRIDSSRVWLTAIAAHTVSRAGAIALAWASRPSVDFKLADRIHSLTAIIAITQGGIVAFAAGPRSGALLIAAAYLLLRLLQAWCYHRRGGIDATGFTVSQAALEAVTATVLGFLKTA